MNFLAALALILSFPVMAQDWASSSRLPAPLPAPVPGDPMQATVHRLPNGLTVYLSPNRQVPRITAHIAVRAGGAQDPADSTGMAHYLEHMLFKGSKRLGTLDAAKEKVHLDRIAALYETLFGETDVEKRSSLYAEIDRENQAAAKFAVPNELDKVYKTLGITGVNAYTSNERTVYTCDMPKNRLEAWAKLEADRFAAPVFRLFQSELETVYEEKNTWLDDAGTVISEALDKALYKDHPYATPILGTIEHLKNPSLAKMYEFYASHYVPNNMAVVLAGDFEPEQALALIEKHLGAWKPKALSADRHPAIPPLTKPERVEVRYESEEMMLMAWPTVPVSHPDADAVTVMDMVVSNAESGLVDLRLNQAQKVKTAGSTPGFRNEAGVWTMWALPKEGQTLEEAEALLMGMVADLKKGDFSEEDLKAIVLDFEIGEKYKLESNGSRVSEMVDAFAEYAEWPERAARLERLRRVTKDDVVRVANKYLGEGRAVAYRRKGKPVIPSMTKPAFTKVDIAPGRESAFYRDVIRTPAAPIEPKWVKKGADYVEAPTAFGKVVAVKNPVNDLFSLSYNIERGRRHDRAQCAAVGLWGKSGAGELSADALKRRLYALGIKMNAWCGEARSGWSLAGPDASLEPALALLRTRFQSPNVEPGTLEKMTAIWIGQHKDSKIDPGAINGALTEWAERGAESAVLLDLSDAELKALKESDLKAALADFPAWQGRAAYVGPRSAEAVAELLKEPGAAYKPAPERRPVTYVKPEGPRVIFTHRDMVQSNVGLYAADGTVELERSVDYRFYNNYMGGGMSSVIFQEVREARSLAYSAWGGYGTGSRPGDENRLMGRLGCQADKTIDAVELLGKLLKDPPAFESRFKEAKESILQTYRTDPLTFREVPGAVLAWEDLGLSEDPRPKRFERSKGYTLKDLLAFSKRFKDKALTVHILGNRERVDMKALTKFGTLTEKTVDELFPY
ncbi:MAG: insulinase family protein [Elusimicrobia bacterium]|nr:insulinase family protein [Elusimicrobiota bacterium]